jgi:uncharacterized membrane protein
MEPAVVVGLLWLGFGAFHIGLGSTSVRSRLVAGLGELGFTALFSVVATVWFTAVMRWYAAHRWEGAMGLGLGQVAMLRWLLMAVVGGGIVLMTAGLVVYPRLPSALFGQPIRAPHGIERVTRHPFFAGVAMLGLGHAFLATRLVGAVFALCLALVAILGAWHQDAKFLARRGWVYGEYLRVTSAVPFAAILSGRQQLVWRELPAGALLAGLAFAMLLRAGHAGLFAAGGTWIVVAVVGGGAIATLQSWRRARRLGAIPVAEPRSA